MAGVGDYRPGRGYRGRCLWPGLPNRCGLAFGPLSSFRLRGHLEALGRGEAAELDVRRPSGPNPRVGLCGGLLLDGRHIIMPQCHKKTLSCPCGRPWYPCTLGDIAVRG